MKKLHDSTIAHVAKILQVALLTGTDIIDHLRLIDLVEDDQGFLVLENAYLENHDNSIEKMLEQINNKEKD